MADASDGSDHPWNPRGRKKRSSLAQVFTRKSGNVTRRKSVVARGGGGGAGAGGGAGVASRGRGRGRGKGKRKARRQSIALVAMGTLTETDIWALGDPKPITIKISSDTTALEACMLVRKKIGLHNDGDFSLFDWTDKACFKIADDEVLATIVKGWPKNAESADAKEHHRFVYRRWIYVPDGVLEQEEMEATEPDKKGYGALRLAYYDAQYHFLRGLYRVPGDKAMQLAALSLVVADGTFNKHLVTAKAIQDKLHLHVPAPLLTLAGSSDKKSWASRVKSLYAGLTLSHVDAMKQYIDELISTVDVYGSFFIKAVIQRPASDKERLIDVAIHYTGIALYITRRGEVSVEFHGFDQIQQWSVLDEGMEFAYWLPHEELVTLTTPEAVTVDELVQAYIAENLAVLDGLAASGARRKTISAKDTKLAALKEEAQSDDEIEVDETAVAAAAKAAGYLVATDKKTKRTFYHHKETQKSVWTLPTEVMNDAFVIAVARASSGKKKAAGGGAGAGAGAGVGAASASSMTGLSWWYTDGTGTQQGPFSNEQMRYWFLDGFFDASSKVKASKGPHAGAFVPISAVVGKGKALESAFAMSG